MNNRDDDFAINSDVVLYNMSLTEMHSGGEDGMGETFGMKHGWGWFGWFGWGWCRRIGIYSLLRPYSLLYK